MNPHKGIVAPLLLILVAILLIGGGAYVFTQNKQDNSPIAENAALPQTDQFYGWKTHTDDRDNISFKYPSTWYESKSAAGASSAFLYKSVPEPKKLPFLGYYVTALALGKEGSALTKVTPQEYFDYYSAPTPGVPDFQSIKLNGIPVVYRKVSDEHRYLIYTKNLEIGFVLYPGDSTNHTEYDEQDDVVVEQMIKSLNIINPVEVSINSAPKLTYASSIKTTPVVAAGIIKSGDTVYVTGQNLGGTCTTGCPTTVFVGGKLGTVISLGEQQMTFKAPQLANGTYDMYALTKDGQKSNVLQVSVGKLIGEISAPRVTNATMRDDNVDSIPYIFVEGTGFSSASKIHITGNGFDGILSPVNYTWGDGSDGKNLGAVLPKSIDIQTQYKVYNVYVTDGSAVSNTFVVTIPNRG